MQNRTAEGAELIFTVNIGLAVNAMKITRICCHIITWRVPPAGLWLTASPPLPPPALSALPPPVSSPVAVVLQGRRGRVGSVPVPDRRREEGV